MAGRATANESNTLCRKPSFFKAVSHPSVNCAVEAGFLMRHLGSKRYNAMQGLVVNARDGGKSDEDWKVVGAQTAFAGGTGVIRSSSRGCMAPVND